MQLKPYWLDTAPAFSAGAEGGMPSKADVVVIGGGLTGLSAALALARDGVDVVVLEAARVVGAGSGRNGGHCNNGLAKGFSDVVAKLGRDRAKSLYQAFDSAVDSVERLVSEEEIDCNFRRSGKIQIASKPAHFNRLVKAHELLSEGIDTETEIVSAKAITSEVNSPMFHGGLLYKRSAMLHVGRFGVGLAHAASRRGAKIFENTAVTGLKRIDGSRYEVLSDCGSISSENVFVATGADTDSPFTYFRKRIVPIGSFVIATEPLSPQKLDGMMPTRRTAVTTKNIGNYFRISPDNRIIFGGRARFARSSPDSDAKSGRILMHTLREVFPQLGDVKIDYCWGGLLDVTTDRLPRAGQKDGLYFSMGYSGHGVQMAVHMGQIMATIMTGGNTANPLADLSWKSVPGYAGMPWFLPLIGTYYRLLDRLT